MNIEFKKITFDNFLSYKENNIYVFDKGLDLLSGKNGRGKCQDKNTIIEVEVDEDIKDIFNEFINKENNE